MIKQALSKAKKAKKRGDTLAAYNIYSAVLQRQPDNPVAKKALRKLEKNLPNKQAMQKRAGNPPQNQINALINLYQTGQLANTEQTCINLLQNYPQAFFIFNILGAALQGQGRFQEAVQAFSKAIEINPDYAQAYNNRGNALRVLGKLNEAEDSCNKAIELMPDYADAYSNLGNILSELGQLDAAIQCCEKAIELKPDFRNVHAILCDLYEKHNMVDALKSALRNAQEALSENDPELLFRLALLANSEKRLEDARDLLELIIPENLTLETRIRYSDLLSKVYDKLGDFSKAFSQFEITNNIVKQSSSAQLYSAQAYFEKISKTSRAWEDASNINWPEEQATADHDSLVFLVGFPRSGTTLLDTILRSHPEVLMVEEKNMVQSMLNHIGDIATADLLSSLDDEQKARLREIYFKELYSHVKPDDSHKLIIDKMPLNITNAGLIHRVFPDSKFILALRHPYDCVLSCFMQNFKLNDAMSNFLNLQQSARLYDAVMKLWFHYNNSLALNVGTLKYEDLVQDLQGTAEPLLNFLGLDWNENLLNYQQTAFSRGTINTPSYNQVTQSLYTQAIDRWKNYEDQTKVVAPLLELWTKKFGYTTEL